MVENYIIDNSNNGGQFKQFTQTLQAGEIYTFQENFTSFRVLNLTNSDACEYKLGRNSSWTPLETGVGVHFNQVLPSVSIHNKSNAPVEITVAFAIGEITDDRTTFTGTLDVSIESPKLASYQNMTFEADTPLTIDATDYKNILIQNKSEENPIYLFAEDGLIIPANADFSADFGGIITVYGTTGSLIGVLMFN